MHQGYGIGSVLNEAYRLERELGRGPLGALYAATDLRGGRDCAVRILPEAANQMVGERERFLRDHKVLAQLADSRLPPILDCAATAEGHLYIVNEMWRGDTLRQRLRRGTLPLKLGCSYIDQLCQALGLAHARGVTHGDVRPETIVIGPNDRIQLIEVGIHHFRVGSLRTWPKPAPGVGWYVPREQLDSPTLIAEPRADVFALGAVLYEAFTGRPAFPMAPQTAGPAALPRHSGLQKLVTTTIMTQELANALEQLLLRACAADPADRPPDAQGLSEQLRMLFGPLLQSDEEASGDFSPDGTLGKRSRRRPLRSGEGEPPEAVPPATPVAPAAPLKVAPPEAEPPPATTLVSPEPSASAPSPVAARLAAIAKGESRPGPLPLRAPDPLRRPFARPIAAPPTPAKVEEPEKATPPQELEVPSPRTPRRSVTPKDGQAPLAVQGESPTFPVAAGNPSELPTAAEGSKPQGGSGTTPTPDTEEKSTEAAKAIAAARAAASARLLEAARKRARQGPPVTSTGAPDATDATRVPQAVAPAASRSNKRRAPADLQELPPAAGEVVTQPKAPPTLEAAQIIVDLPADADLLEEDPSDAPSGVTPPRSSQSPPPLPVTRPMKQQPLPEAGPPKVYPPTQRVKPILAQGFLRIDEGQGGEIPLSPVGDGEIRATQEVDVVLRPQRGNLGTLRNVVLASIALIFVAVIFARLLPSSPVAPVVDTPTPPPAVAQPNLKDPGQLLVHLAEVDKAISERSWRAAVLRVDQALAHFAGNQDLLSRRQKAETEMENQARYESFKNALERKNNEAAMALYAEIPESSAYRQLAQADVQLVQGDYIAAKLTEARAARRLGLCAEVRRLTQAILALSPDNEEAATLETRCTEERKPKKPAAEKPSKEPEEPQLSPLKELRDPFKTK